VRSVLVLGRWCPDVRVTLSCHCCCTASYKDGTTSVRVLKLTDRLDLTIVPRLGTTNDSGGTTACVDTCVSQGSSQMVSSRPVLGRVIRRADTGGHNSSL